MSSDASEKLPATAVRAWHIRDKEAYACVWGVLKHRYFLLNSWFLVETDHENCSSIRWILRDKVPAKLARWGCLLSEYNFSIRPTKGKDNQAADCLSRCEVAAAAQPPLPENLDRSTDSIVFFFVYVGRYRPLHQDIQEKTRCQSVRQRSCPCQTPTRV